jgi:hypothetical protein
MLLLKSWSVMAHTYSPSYSGGRDGEDLGPRLGEKQETSEKVKAKRAGRIAQLK